MKEITRENVRNILCDYYRSGECDSDCGDGVVDVIKKVDDWFYGEDTEKPVGVTTEEFIKAWAHTYFFARCFNPKKESVEKLANNFIDDNAFDYLEQLKEGNYIGFVDGLSDSEDYGTAYINEINEMELKTACDVAKFLHAVYYFVQYNYDMRNIIPVEMWTAACKIAKVDIDETADFNDEEFVFNLARKIWDSDVLANIYR